METDKNYLLVGLFVIAVILGGIGFTLWLVGTDKGPMVDYRIHFAESVGGLRAGSMVRFNGVDVGTVKEIAIDPENAKLSRVDIRIQESTPVKTDTVATLELLGISGEVYVQLKGGGKTAALLKDVSKDEVPEIRAEQSRIAALMDRLPKIAEKADTLLAKGNHVADQISKVFSDRNVRSVNSVVRKLGKRFGDEEE